MRAQFLGKDPRSNVGDSPTLFATDRTDRRTYIAQGWRVTDPQALADVVQHNYWRDAAWHHALRRDEFATEEHLRRS
jgi:hypothetical protein